MLLLGVFFWGGGWKSWREVVCIVSYDWLCAIFTLELTSAVKKECITLYTLYK